MLIGVAGLDAIIASAFPPDTAWQRATVVAIGAVCIVAEIAVIYRDRNKFEVERREYNDRLLGVHKSLSRSDALLTLKQEAFNLVSWIGMITESVSYLEEQLAVAEILELREQLMVGLERAETLAMMQFRTARCHERINDVISRFSGFEIFDDDLSTMIAMGIEETGRLRWISDRIKSLAERI